MSSIFSMQSTPIKRNFPTTRGWQWRAPQGESVLLTHGCSAPSHVCPRCCLLRCLDCCCTGLHCRLLSWHRPEEYVPFWIIIALTPLFCAPIFSRSTLVSSGTRPKKPWPSTETTLERCAATCSISALEKTNWRTDFSCLLKNHKIDLILNL